MIARIHGDVIEHDGSHIIVDCGGVGYGIEVAVDEQSTLPVGTKANLYIAENIKEDAHELFGFAKKTRKLLFDLLISVNGVGPKAAMAIMNIGSEGQVRGAIANGDTKFITAAKGIGKRVAERIVVDLKNKVGLEATDSATDFLSQTTASDEAVQALVSLGYTSQDAVERLRGVDRELPTSDRIKQALKGHS
ncbi:MAG: Holliday junction branch migration protein RuvA [Candidatus Saccharibacteria bacterium]|nr:Holliday junction branch migration protein RuvA [Candidatus Saccharibacteria bacterium]